MDRGAWRATVQRVTKSQTWPSMHAQAQSLWHACKRGVIVDSKPTGLRQGQKCSTEMTNNAGGASLEGDWGPGAEKSSSWNIYMKGQPDSKWGCSLNCYMQKFRVQRTIWSWNYSLGSSLTSTVSKVLRWWVQMPWKRVQREKNGTSWLGKSKWKSLSCVSDSSWPHRLGACQAPLSMWFSRPEYWSGLPFPSPEDLSDPETEPRSPSIQADPLPSEPPGKPPFKNSLLDGIFLIYKYK